MHALQGTAAFFDLDKTLLAKSSGELYIRVMREQGILSRKEVAKLFFASILYRLNLLEPENLMEKVAEKYRGQNEQEMIDSCEDWFRETVKNYFYTTVLKRVKEHQAKGHVLALLTASTIYVAGPTGRFLDIDHILCTRLEVENGLFTGKIHKPVCHDKGKLYWARQFCETHNVDIKKSYFYTDSIQDISTLNAVGFPIPVNPDRSLQKTAIKNGWPIERYKTTLGPV